MTETARYPSGISPLNNVYRLFVTCEEIEGFIRAKLILREYETLLNEGNVANMTWVSSRDSIKRALKTLDDVIARGMGKDKLNE